jgi:hypothetical protein
MFETYRMLGREREAELESEAARLRPLAGRPINRISVVIVAVIVASLALGATVARAEVWPNGRSGAQLTTQPAPPDTSSNDGLRATRRTCWLPTTASEHAPPRRRSKRRLRISSNDGLRATHAKPARLGLRAPRKPVSLSTGARH